MSRKVKDTLLKAITYIASVISVFILAAILIYLVQHGLSSINLDLLTSNYNAQTFSSQISPDYEYTKSETNVDATDYSSKWGVAFEDVETVHKTKEIVVSYVDPNSPFANLVSTIAGQNGKSEALKPGHVIQSFYYTAADGSEIYLSQGKMQNAENLIKILDTEVEALGTINYQSLGGGIKGSIITTLYLILISLLLSLPVGIASAIYLHEYASKNRFNSLIRQGIDTLTGVPSIVYGLMGVTVLFPVTQLFGATSTSILLGGLTLAIILLPTIIRSTEEALIIVPQSLRDGSLSLGATKSQTIFKVVIPCAMNGILTGVLLGIGRVIGESAALVYTTSTVINDSPTLLSQGTSLALMIWSIMSGEQPNFELASAISLIILIIVFAINTIVKIIGKRFAKSFV